MCKYFFTTYGDLYFGFDMGQHLIPNHKVIIPGTSYERYSKLTRNEKIPERIREFGHIVKTRTIVNEFYEKDIQLIPKNHDYNVSWDGHYHRKHMFIFGAGASANCCYDGGRFNLDMDPYKPPCGTGIFHSTFRDILAKYPGVGQYLMHYRGKDIDIEDLFEKQWKEVQDGNEAIMSRHINVQMVDFLLL